MAGVRNLIARFLYREQTNLWEEPEPEPEYEHSTNLSELPENCISAILSFTTSRDVCKLSAVSKIFRSAAYSNTLWNKFLPQQCQQNLPRALTPIAFSSKRELYFILCNSILVDGGRKRFWLERPTGKIGYMLSARELSIISGNDPRFWRWVSRNDSRFEEVAALLAVIWLEVGGRIDCRVLSVGCEYRVLFVLKFGEYPQGWNEKPVKFSVTTQEGKETESEHLLMERQRIGIGGWMEVVAGEFTATAAENNDEDSSYIEFCMKEVEAGYWKGGLLIDGVRIEPKCS